MEMTEKTSMGDLLNLIIMMIRTPTPPSYTLGLTVAHDRILPSVIDLLEGGGKA
jgi:hypothetical protein